MDQQQLDETPI